MSEQSSSSAIVAQRTEGRDGGSVSATPLQTDRGEDCGVRDATAATGATRATASARARGRRVIE